ncbi:hypothetical protein HDV05_003845 [Chytridiales sp. JEL 0842]|nr:hypothetical protein HDV05_003845 [Chytridiales sp. JEL 0842]
MSLFRDVAMSMSPKRPSYHSLKRPAALDNDDHIFATPKRANTQPGGILSTIRKGFDKIRIKQVARNEMTSCPQSKEQTIANTDSSTSVRSARNPPSANANDPLAMSEDDDDDDNEYTIDKAQRIEAINVRTMAKGKIAEKPPVSREFVDDDDSEDELISGDYIPPRGFHRINIGEDPSTAPKYDYKKLTSDGKELWLIRLPADLPIETLNGVKIQLSKSSSDKPLAKFEKPVSSASISKKMKSKTSIENETFAVYDLQNSPMEGGEVGEMAEMQCLVPEKGSGTYRIAPKGFSKYLSVIPVIEIPTLKALETAAVNARNVPYVPRSHPESMKVQYEPFGATTDGVTLEESMERYALPRPDEGSTINSSKKRKVEEAKSPKSKKTTEKVQAGEDVDGGKKKKKKRE